MEYIVCWDVAATFVCMSPMCTLESWLIQKDYVCVSHGISTGFSRETSQKTQIFPIFYSPEDFKKKKEKAQKLKMLNYHGQYWLGSMLRRALQEINLIDTAKTFNSPKVSWPLESPCLPEPFFHGEMEAVRVQNKHSPIFFFGFESVRRAVHSPKQNKKRLTVWVVCVNFQTKKR